MSFETTAPLSLLTESRLSEVTPREYDWVFAFSSGVRIVASSSHWRLLDGERIIVTDEDHGHMFGLKEPVDAAAVVNGELNEATVNGTQVSRVSDLVLSFSNGRALEVLCSSGGYESWQAFGPDNSQVIASGAGGLYHVAP